MEEEEIDNARLITSDTKIHNADSKIGFVDADFQYYMAKEKVKDPKKKSKETGNAEEKKPLLAEDEIVAPSFQLNNIDVVFPIGQLTTIVGSTGAGKTSLLLALLGGNIVMD